MNNQNTLDKSEQYKLVANSIKYNKDNKYSY